MCGILGVLVKNMFNTRLSTSYTANCYKKCGQYNRVTILYLCVQLSMYWWKFFKNLNSMKFCIENL